MDMSLEELAVRQTYIHRTTGVKYARHEKGWHTPSGKAQARKLIVDLLKPHVWHGKLKILTMPSVMWKFEHLLIRKREYKQSQKRTLIYSVENDPAIYAVALKMIPGGNFWLKAKNKPTDLYRTYKSPHIKRYSLCSVEDYMTNCAEEFDVAWLDFTGPITSNRMNVIKKFYREKIRHILILTALNGRWDKEASDRIDESGTLFKWFSDTLPGKILHQITYRDTANMVQFAVKKEDEIYGY